jgi:hypothetical protein
MLLALLFYFQRLLGRRHGGLSLVVVVVVVVVVGGCCCYCRWRCVLVVGCRMSLVYLMCVSYLERSTDPTYNA